MASDIFFLFWERGGVEVLVFRNQHFCQSTIVSMHGRGLGWHPRLALLTIGTETRAAAGGAGSALRAALRAAFACCMLVCQF
jgi:hypothetical protein